MSHPCPNCERLTRELAECASIGNRIVDQKMAIAAERDRLRAALERLAGWPDGSDHPVAHVMAEIAREALAGAADETTGG